MRFCLRTLAVPSLLFAAACSGSSPDPSSGPGGPTDPGQPGGGQPGATVDQLATNLGVTIMSKDERGAPRLIRSIVPRAGLRGATAEAIARDHVAALAPLWVQSAAPMAMVHNGAQVLRNGATVVQLAQHVNGVLVDGGDLRVLLHSDGALAAVSGTLQPAASAPAFASSAREALERALDQQYGTSRPALAISDAGDVGGWTVLQVADDPQLRVSDARARPVLATVGGQMTATWEVELIGDAPAPDALSEAPAPTLAAHNYLVADASGSVVRDIDLDANDAFVYRAYAETTGNRRPLDGPLQSFTPHPTGVTTVTLMVTLGAAGVARVASPVEAISSVPDAAVILSAPATSLRDHDAGVCVLQDT